MHSSTLHEDLSKFMVCLNEHHFITLRMANYCGTLIERGPELEATPFIHDEMIKIKAVYTDCITRAAACKETEESIISQYVQANKSGETECNVVGPEGTLMLKRILTKALELFHLPVFHRETFKFKHTVLDLLSSSKTLTVLSVLELITQYILLIAFSQQEKLKYIINLIQEGSLSELASFKDQKFFVNLETQHIRGTQIESEEKEKEKKNISEKEKIKQRVKDLRKEAKEYEQIKKERIEVAKKIFKNFSCVMDIVKESFLEEYVEGTKQKQKDELLESLTLRNRINSEQIESLRKQEHKINKKIFYPLKQTLPEENENEAFLSRNLSEKEVSYKSEKNIFQICDSFASRQNSNDPRLQIFKAIERKLILKKKRTTLNEIGENNSIEPEKKEKITFSGMTHLPEIVSRGGSVGKEVMQRNQMQLGQTGVKFVKGDRKNIVAKSNNQSLAPKEGLKIVGNEFLMEISKLSKGELIS